MKKTLLTLAILLGLSSAAKAENIVEDWTTANTWAVTAWTDKVTTPEQKTSSETGITYTFMGSYVSKFKEDPAYLFIKGKGTKGAYVSFTLPVDCAEIILTTSSGTSTSAKSTINVYAGDEKIATSLLVNAQNNDNKVVVPAKYRAKGTVYKVESNTASYNQQFFKFTYVEPSVEPSISLIDSSVDFATMLNGTQTKIVKGSAENLTENISVSVDNDAFVLSATSITAAELTDGIEVTYTGKTAGTTTATLTFKSGNLTETVALSAFTVAHEGTESDPLSVSDVLALNNKATGSYFVKGIISDKCGANAKNDMVTETATLVNTNIVLKDCDDQSQLVGVAIVSASRPVLNIKDNPSNAGQTVIVKGTLEPYFGAPGVKNAEYISGLTTTGIENIEADVNAPVEYYNLQGIRVNNPENGLYIRRQGNKVTKVIVK